MHRHAVEREKTFLHAVGLTCVLVCAQEHRRDDFGRIPGCPGPLEILQCRVETPESKSNAMWKTKIHDSTVLIENSHQIPGVPSYTTGIQEYPVCQPESRIHPSRIQEYPSTSCHAPAFTRFSSFAQGAASPAESRTLMQVSATGLGKQRGPIHS